MQYRQGIEVINLKNAECEALMKKFIQDHPEDWSVTPSCRLKYVANELPIGTRTSARIRRLVGYQSLIMRLRSCMDLSAQSEEVLRGRLSEPDLSSLSFA